MQTTTVASTYPTSWPEPKDRPILFRGEMIRAILDGRKTQTRRVIKPQPEMHLEPDTVKAAWLSGFIDVKCPYGRPGDRLWVRETWHNQAPETLVRYKASGDDLHELKKWKPSIHMPRWASRITLEVKSVRVERVQDISEADARAEGIVGGMSESGSSGWGNNEGMPEVYKAKWGFKALWNTMRADTEFSWERNPWVWVIEFNRWASPKASDAK
jgi:hypothetical protein